MSAQIPSDVMMFLAELDQLSTALMHKYFDESEADQAKEGLYATKQFKHFVPLTIRIFSNDTELARFYEEGVDIYPKSE